ITFRSRAWRREAAASRNARLASSARLSFSSGLSTCQSARRRLLATRKAWISLLDSGCLPASSFSQRWWVVSACWRRWSSNVSSGADTAVSLYSGPDGAGQRLETLPSCQGDGKRNFYDSLYDRSLRRQVRPLQRQKGSSLRALLK